MQKTLSAAQERHPVIVFTCGRSGSTLLIRMLNCLPGTIMWGEHNGALKPLLSSYKRVRDVAGNRFVARAAEYLQPVYDRQPIVSERGMSIEWLNWFGEADIDRLYRELITGLFYPESVRDRFARWGFKEIQYRESELGMLRHLFPGMKAIILYRNPAAVFASQFKNFAKGNVERLPTILNNVERFYQFAAQQAERHHELEDAPLFISYEETAGQFNETARKLQSFLGEEFLSSVEEIGSDIHSFQNHRGRKKWTGKPIKDFDAWQESMEIALPEKQIRSIASSYSAVVKATTARACVRAQ